MKFVQTTSCNDKNGNAANYITISVLSRSLWSAGAVPSTPKSPQGDDSLKLQIPGALDLQLREPCLNHMETVVDSVCFTLISTASSEPVDQEDQEQKAGLRHSPQRPEVDIVVPSALPVVLNPRSPLPRSKTLYFDRLVRTLYLMLIVGI